MVVNKTKQEAYVNKVYKGDLKRYQEKQKKNAEFSVDKFLFGETKATKGSRLAPTSRQGVKVVEDCKRQCVICGKNYDKNPGDFAIHHVDGDRSYTVTSNLVLLCLSCHKKVHDIAGAKLRDYINKKEKSKPKNVSWLDREIKIKF